MQTFSHGEETNYTSFSGFLPDLRDFPDTEVPSEGDEWFPDLVNLVEAPPVPRLGPTVPRLDPNSLRCITHECDQPGTFNGQCYEHFQNSLPDREKNRATSKRRVTGETRIEEKPANRLIVRGEQLKQSELGSGDSVSSKSASGQTEPARPKLHKVPSSPGKPKKLPKQVAMYLASAGEPSETLQDLSDPIPNYKVRKSSVVFAIEEVDEGTTPIYEATYIPNHKENTLDFRTIPKNWDSSGEDRDPRQVLAEITYSSVTHPWPGRDGPRDAMVLSGVLRECWHRRSLDLDVALMQFGPEVGLVSYVAIRDALTNLERIGYFGFVLGKEDDWKPGGEMGHPSKITLNPRTNPTGTFWPTNLPLPSLDLFSYDQLGPGGWLILARVIMEWQLGEFDDQKYRDQPVLGIADLVRLTGMTKGRTIEVMKVMVENGPAIKRDRKYEFYNLADLSDRNTYPDYKTRDRREKLALDRKRRGDHYRPPADR